MTTIDFLLGRVEVADEEIRIALYWRVCAAFGAGVVAGVVLALVIVMAVMAS